MVLQRVHVLEGILSVLSEFTGLLYAKKEGYELKCEPRRLYLFIPEAFYE